MPEPGTVKGGGFETICALALLPCPLVGLFPALAATGVRPSLGASLPKDMIESDRP